MDPRIIPSRDADAVCRLIRALGSNRYVAGAAHDVHAFVLSSVPRLCPDLSSRAAAILDGGTVDCTSRDERLYLRVSSRELSEILRGFWIDEHRAEYRQALRNNFERFSIENVELPLFDEAAEDYLYPVLIDAGWELHALSELDPERHRGVFEAYGDELRFQVAAFEEANCVPHVPPLMELPLLGYSELCEAVSDSGELLADAPIWMQGPEVYLDYLWRGVLKVARVE